MELWGLSEIQEIRVKPQLLNELKRLACQLAILKKTFFEIWQPFKI
jgi:hypothetical protein